MSEELAKQLEELLHANAEAVFDTTASCFDEEEALAIAALIAQVCVQTGPAWSGSHQVREMLEKYAALDTSYPHRPK